MALFNIQRYDGKEQLAKEETHKDDILLNLQNKIAAKRKKIAEDIITKTETTTVNRPENALTENNNEDEKSPKKKQAKLNNEDNDNNVDADVVTKKNSKKKKNKNKIVVTNTEDVENQVYTPKFEVIGEDVKKQKQPKVDMILPPWLANPTIIEGSMQNTTEGDDQDNNLLSCLTPQLRQTLKEKLHIDNLFPVQRTVIPWLLKAHTRPLPFRPRDVCVSAPTGSGKTLAFALPVVQLLSGRVERQIRALIVLPVAELALQIYKVFLKLCSNTDLVVQLLSKQTPFNKEQQQLVALHNDKYYSKADIIVTTPGRLIDHLHGTSGFTLHALKFLIIDEADRIVDTAFQNWLQHYDVHMASHQTPSTNALNYNGILARATQPHKLLFSATLTQDPEKLQRLHLFHPLLFSAAAMDLQAMQHNYLLNHENNKMQLSNGTDAAETAKMKNNSSKYIIPKELSEKYCLTEAELKPLSLFSLIMEHGWRKFLCFTNSAESSDRLAFVLNTLAKDNLQFEQLSAQMSAKERASTLSNFARGKIDGLICSDALARGIDVPHVDVIVSYDLPRHIKTYVHRIGRTARAGRPGTAVTLLTPKETNLFKKLLSHLDKSVTKELELPRATIEEKYAPSYSEALNILQKKIENEKRNKLLQEKRAKSTNLLLQKSTTQPSNNTFMDKLMQQINAKMPQK